LLNNKITAFREKPRILYAEDVPEMRKIMEYYLSKTFEVQSVGNGHEAFEAFVEGRDKFSLLLTDNDMPLCKGIDLIKRIRELKVHIPIIVFSGDQNLNQSLISAGADFYINKNGNFNFSNVTELLKFFIIP